jgi:hypothetical protein
MLKKIVFITTLALSLASCTSIKNTTKINSNIHAKEYNSIASQYLARPTFVTIEEMSSNEITLAITMDNYKSTSIPVRFSKTDTASYIAMIDKYLEWEKLARTRGDALTKEIGRSKTWSNGPVSGTLKFTFHSGNSSNHLLAIAFCAAGTCLDDTAIYIDPNNARELKILLQDFSDGKITPKNIDDIYK